MIGVRSWIDIRLLQLYVRLLVFGSAVNRALNQRFPVNGQPDNNRSNNIQSETHQRFATEQFTSTVGILAVANIAPKTRHRIRNPLAARSPQHRTQHAVRPRLEQQVKHTYE